MVDSKEHSPQRAAAALMGMGPRAGLVPGPFAPMGAAATAPATNA
ncbi:MAG: hypothetical protein WAL90_09135 [Desulfobacterales bacterium]